MPESLLSRAGLGATPLPTPAVLALTLVLAAGVALLLLVVLPARAAAPAKVAKAARTPTALEAGLARADSLTGDAIPRTGVSLAGLERFQREVAAARGRWRWLLGRCAAPVTTAGLSTDAANALTKAHLTGARRCTFSDLLGGDPALVGEATVFVSHSWAAPLDSLIACVREADAALRRPSHPRHMPGATPYFWVDLVVNNQFAAPSRSFTWWQTVFRENVERIGHTVVALEWQNPRPLGRIWCLWEIFCSTTAAEEGGGDGDGGGGAAAAPRPPTLLELSLPPASAAAFRRDLEYDFGLLAYKLSRIDLRNADAFHGGSCRGLPGGCPAIAAGRPCPDDKAQILGAIAAAPGGVDGVTKRVIAGLRGWMVGEAREALAGIADDDERRASELQYNLAFLLEDGGQLGEAEALMREIVEVMRRTLGSEHRNTLASIGSLATILRGQGKLAEAEPLCREELESSRRTLGDAHSSTLTSINNLALLLEAQGKLAEAEPLCREALDSRRRTLGGAHPDTLTSINNLASLLKNQGKLAEAEPLFREALNGNRRTLGNTYPVTLISINNLASLLHDQGKLADAEPLYREALDGSRRTLGDAHPQTLICIGNLASLLKSKGELAKA